ncbi:DUF6233 domain-containing protein [Streptomyces sp. CA-251251]|uniref:DUF6233 domain-containing protein n=1 Tax=Streptomyces sp. CA-251251 TaxID=3240063 RepID=UPI003D8A73D2
MWVQRIDTKIAAVLKRQAEEQHGRRNRPRPPEWIVELGIGAHRPPLQVHAGDCYIAGTRRRPVDRDEARRLLASDSRPAPTASPTSRGCPVTGGAAGALVGHGWGDLSR